MHIALETRARTREDLEGPAHGDPRTPVPPKGVLPSFAPREMLFQLRVVAG